MGCRKCLMKVRLYTADLMKNRLILKGFSIVKKTFYYILLIHIFLFLLTSELFAEDMFMVKRINDGDTIILNDNRCIRYIGINTPEINHREKKAEPYAYKAKLFNKSILLKKKVRLEFDQERKDQYGRWLAYVFLPDGRFINEEILKQGYGFFLSRYPNNRYDSMLLKAQLKAMLGKKGIWHSWKEKGKGYIGNKRSRRFHLETCRFGKEIRNKTYFSNRWDAFLKGYAPCKKCMSEWW